MKIFSKYIILVFSAILFVQTAISSSAPSFYDSDYVPDYPANEKEILGHYQELIKRDNGTLKIDLWIDSNNLATVEFETIPLSGEEFKVNSKFKGKWNIRNGWVVLSYGNDFVILKFNPKITALTNQGQKTGPGLEGAHALRSGERLLLSRMIKINE